MRWILPILLFFQLLTAQNDSVIVFLSDTQTPMWVEKLYLRSEENEKATQRIFSAILSEKNLLGVVHAGDITSYGMFRSSWEPVLPFIDSLRTKGIPFAAVKGNHDYYFISSRAMKLFREYIPNGNSEYALHRFGSVAVVLLNSNGDELDDETALQQQRWYAGILDSCEADTTLRHVITVAHHSPFTNSDMVTGSQKMRKEYLPAFYRSAKSQAWIGGHAHRFEHFQKNGKNLFVTGGGGGLHHGKRTEKPETDLYSADGRFFHYLRCTIRPQSILLEVRMVKAAEPEPRTVYRCEIPPQQ